MQINKLYAEGKTSEEIHAISQGPDDRARVFNRCFINGFLFRTAQIEKNLSTQNSGVVVKGDDSDGNVYWCGVVKKIYALDFPTGRKSSCLNVTGMTYLLLVRAKVEGLKGTSTGFLLVAKA